MQILKDMIAGISRDAPVREIRQGTYWTAVASRHCGLASVAFDEDCPVHPQRRLFDGSAAGQSAVALASLALSPNKLEASLGLASLNSLLSVDTGRCREVNASEVLARVGEGRNVTVIGHFPFVEDLKRRVRNLWVVEKRPQPGDVLEDDMRLFLPISDVVAISSTTLINHTLEGILDLCGDKCVKMLLGPTTPMSEVLFDHGIDLVSGCLVADEETVLRQVGNGANFMELKRSGGVRLVTMERAESRRLI